MVAAGTSVSRDRPLPSTMVVPSTQTPSFFSTARTAFAASADEPLRLAPTAT